ncbi:MAG: HD domain-containing protein [Clostridia bacterium]|nr:HD domain-containing protein [Clostridia bacterium]
MKKINILDRKKINYSELDNDLKIEIAVLGGLDIFTDAHVQGVVNITTKICTAMDLSYEKTKKCILCAYLHDIGKVHIPAAILQKNGKLTDEEYEIMKSHTVYGYEMCLRYDEFKHLAPIIRAHHENYDGSGYPDGLRESLIPEEAKLIKVADVYDALTQKRQYKDGFKSSVAIQIMIEDVQKGKTGAKYIYYLCTYLVDELAKKIKELEDSIDIVKGNLETLKDLESIYKQIYDQGYSNRLARKLSKYDLAPGYDMSANANLLVVNKQKLERLNNTLQEVKNERETIKRQTKQLYRLVRNKEWNSIL